MHYICWKQRSFLHTPPPSRLAAGYSWPPLQNPTPKRSVSSCRLCNVYSLTKHNINVNRTLCTLLCLGLVSRGRRIVRRNSLTFLLQPFTSEHRQHFFQMLSSLGAKGCKFSCSLLNDYKHNTLSDKLRHSLEATLRKGDESIDGKLIAGVGTWK